jgi:predicted dinucleotide-binding enzyme
MLAPRDQTNRTTLQIAGDDLEAKKKDMRFMEAIGYDAIDTGSLSNSWRIEPGTPIYVWPSRLQKIAASGQHR